MHFSKKEENGIFVITVEDSRATVDFSEDLKEELLNHIKNRSPNSVVDLRKVEFIDSSLLGALVVGLKSSTLRHGDLKVVGLQQPVRAMFELTRMHRIFDIYDTLEDALNNF